MYKEILTKPNMSFTNKIILTVSLIIALTTCILGLMSLKTAMAIFEEREREILVHSMDTLRSQVYTSLQTAYEATNQAVHDKSLSTLAKLTADSADEATEYLDDLRDTLDTTIRYSAARPSSAVFFLSVFLENGYVCSTIPVSELPCQTYEECISWIQQELNSDLSNYIPVTWFDSLSLYGSTSGNCLVGSRFVYEDLTLDKIGVVLIGIRQTQLQEIYKSFSGECYLTRVSGKILSSADSRTIDSYCEMEWGDSGPGGIQTVRATLNGEEKIFYAYQIDGSQTVLLFSPAISDAGRSVPIRRYARFMAITIVATVAVGLLLALFFSSGLTRSLVRLKNTVQQVYDGNLNARFHAVSHDEIAYLGIKINDMLDSLDEYAKARQKDAEEKQILELQLLRAQINPHLLYNTLNSTLWIIRQGDQKRAEELVLALGGFFKLALSKGNDEIPLENEIRMIQHYLNVQNLGRGKCFTLKNEIPIRFNSCPILRLTLQTLAENSVIHGFADWRNDGEIILTAHCPSADTLCITLADNGIGIAPEEIEQIQKQLCQEPSKTGQTHYGLYNVHRRIRNTYGAAYGLSLESEVGEYTRVCLTLPLTTPPENPSVFSS